MRKAAVASIAILLFVNGCTSVVTSVVPSCEDLSINSPGSEPAVYRTWLTLPFSQGVIRNASAERYLNSIMARIWPAVGGQGEPPPVYVLPDSAYNAQSTPDRTVFVTWQVLRDADSEAEIAGLLAHEAVHLTRKHYEADAKIEWLRKFCMTAAWGTLLAGNDLGKTVAFGSMYALLVTRSVPLRIAFPVWSQPRELEADLLAADALVQAEYGADGVRDFLQKLKQSEENGSGRRLLRSSPHNTTSKSQNEDDLVRIILAEQYDLSIPEHPKTETRISQVDQAIKTKYREIPPSSYQLKQEELQTWQQSNASFLNALKDLSVVWANIREASGDRTRAPALLQQAEAALSTIYPETFTAVELSPKVTQRRKRKKSRTAHDDAPQPIPARQSDTVEEIRQSFSANFAALELLTLRGQSQKAAEYLRRIFASDHIPLGFFTTRAAVELNRANYEMAHTYLVEARRRYGEQYSMFPALIWAYRGLAHERKKKKPDDLDLVSGWKATCYSMKCVADMDIGGKCQEVEKKFR